MTGVRPLIAWENSWTTAVDDASGGRKERFRDRDLGFGPLACTRNPRARTLASAIEGEIIPRLMLAHQMRADVNSNEAFRSPAPDDAAELARLTVAHELSLARSYVEALLDSGVSLEDVLLRALAPAAKLLGDLWMNDLCSFTDVTVGLCHLQQLARELGPSLERERSPAGGSRPTVALAPAPGEQHVFGLMLLEHFSRRAGWDVWTAGARPSLPIPKLVESEWIAVVGFTVSNDELLDGLAELIAETRRSSLNPNLAILVGGAAAAEDDGLAARVGACAAPRDVHEALAFMDAHLTSVGGVKSQ